MARCAREIVPLDGIIRRIPLRAPLIFDAGLFLLFSLFFSFFLLRGSIEKYCNLSSCGYGTALEFPARGDFNPVWSPLPSLSSSFQDPPFPVVVVNAYVRRPRKSTPTVNAALNNSEKTWLKSDEKATRRLPGEREEETRERKKKKREIGTMQDREFISMSTVKVLRRIMQSLQCRERNLRKSFRNSRSRDLVDRGSLCIYVFMN